MKARRDLGFLRATEGAAAVEFALIVGPLVLLLVAVIEVGRLIWSGHALEEVAIVGARCVGIHAPGCATNEVVTPALAIAFVQKEARGWGLALLTGNVSLATNAGCGVQTGFLRVALTYSFVSVLPGLSGTQLVAEACYPSQI